MGLRNFFHKIKIGFDRMHGPSLPRMTEAKRYGDWGEDDFAHALQSRLPDCKIKRNIIIHTAEGAAEIDCIVLYKNKLFAIEIKRWKGHLVERGNSFIQYKRDRWTDEIHTKVFKSPFKQLGRAVYLLRKQIPDNAWLNTIVFFEDSDSIETESDNIWFNDIDELVLYIRNDGKISFGNASFFFERCIDADYLCDNSRGTSRLCIVCDDSLHFESSIGPLNRSNIRSISITHHWSYDELKITTKNGMCATVTIENGAIHVIENGYKHHYALSKLDRIYLAN